MKYYIVGCGPGDNELLTLKAVRIIENSNLILSDGLISKDILKLANPDTKLIDVGKTHDRNGKNPVDRIKEVILSVSDKNCVICHLKNGDPSIFGRMAEEIQTLKSLHMDFEIIPGIPSATGIASILGFPLTARGISRSVSFVTASGSSGDYLEDNVKHILEVSDSTVIFMASTKIRELKKTFLEIGYREPILIVERGTHSDQRIRFFNSIDEMTEDLIENLKTPTIFFTGRSLLSAFRGGDTYGE